MVIIVAAVLLQDEGEWDNKVPGSSEFKENSEAGILIDASKTGAVAKEAPGPQRSLENQGKQRPEVASDFSIWNAKTWLEIQAIADLAFGRWSLHNHVPGDTGIGFLDGVVSGGFDMTTRFHLNAVSAFTELLQEQKLCRFRLEARPIHGDDAEAYGTVVISLTIRDEPCYSPQDLVGKHFTHEDLEDINVQVSSYFMLDESGNNGWGTLWTSRKDGYHFDLNILGHEDGYLLGTVETRLELRSYQGENVHDQHRRGHLTAVFRAAI